MKKNMLLLIFLLLSFYGDLPSFANVIVDSSGNKYLTIGSSKEEVVEILGTPSKINSNLNWWYYGLARIEFDSKDLIKAYNDSNKLKILLVPKSKNIKSEEKTLNPSIPTSSKKSIDGPNTTASSTSTQPSFGTFGSGYGEISEKTGRAKTVHVSGYTRKDGTYVKPHYRSPPKRK